MAIRPKALNIHSRTGTKKSLTYIWGEDGSREMEGWVPQGWDDAVAVFGMGVAHDVIEHRTYDDINLSELDALGRMAVVRYHGQYSWGFSALVRQGSRWTRDTYLRSAVDTVEGLLRDHDLREEPTLLEPAPQNYMSNMLIRQLESMLEHVVDGDLMTNILNHINKGYMSVECTYADQMARTFESIEAHVSCVQDNYTGQHLTVNTYWEDDSLPPGVEFEVDGDIQELCLPAHLME